MKTDYHFYPETKIGLQALFNIEDSILKTYFELCAIYVKNNSFFKKVEIFITTFLKQAIYSSLHKNLLDALVDVTTVLKVWTELTKRSS